ncbi:hypothetical protein [Nonomuraea sp. NPDC050783]|uniref:cyanobactin maturation protease PatG family protein n=1 Tax=Nonomuraea sp. NPDC050783 TaxID=3154634 RepID=UPI0034665B58
MPAALTDFLARIYHDLRNRGATGPERALNFAATNAVQARDVLSDALRRGLALQHIDVEPSPHARPASEVFDVTLRFFDPDNSHRAKRLYRYAIDVTDVMPVTVGPARTWPQA